MQWKKDGPTAYAASWQGIRLSLREDPASKRWQLRSDGKRVDQDWASAQIAMRVVDDRQQTLIRRAMLETKWNGGLRPHEPTKRLAVAHA